MRAIVQAADAVSLIAGPDGAPVRLGFGPQTDARPIRHGDDLPGTGQALSGQAVANYIAKYATKSLTAPGLPDRRIRTAFDMQRPPLLRPLQADDRHRLAARLKARDRRSRLRQWAHMLGYGGHFLTKSRRYSVTFGQLRAARTSHRRAQRHPDGERDPWGRPLDETTVLVLATWTYAGTGYTPQAPVLSWRSRRPTWHVAAREIGGSPSTRLLTPNPTPERRRTHTMQPDTQARRAAGASTPTPTAPAHPYRDGGL